MHEMSLAEGVLDVIEDAAQAQGFSRVTAVWLEIGRLAAVEPDALRFSFDAVKRGTIADRARIEIVDVPGQAWCMKCGDTVAIDERGAACPACGSYQLQVSGGEDLRVKELEVV
ncbi:MAG: hydrogenase maturation nickel metallochaperone HypA [Gemmatimonadota bacterium]